MIFTLTINEFKKCYWCRVFEGISMQIPPHFVLLQHCLKAGQSFPLAQRNESSVQALRASGLDGSGQPVGEMTTQTFFLKASKNKHSTYSRNSCCDSGNSNRLQFRHKLCIFL